MDDSGFPERAKGRHLHCTSPCPLYPRKRTLIGAIQVRSNTPRSPAQRRMALPEPHPPNAPLYLPIASRGWYTAAVSILRFDNDAFNAFNLRFSVQVGFLWSNPAVQFGQYLDRAYFVRRFDIPRIQFRALECSSVFRWPMRNSPRLSWRVFLSPALNRSNQYTRRCRIAPMSAIGPKRTSITPSGVLVFTGTIA